MERAGERWGEEGHLGRLTRLIDLLGLVLVQEEEYHDDDHQDHDHTHQNGHTNTTIQGNV